MRVSDDTRFPHPVLSQQTGDFLAGEFDVAFAGIETPSTGALTLQHTINLTEPSIREMVINGNAAVGCFVRCNDTYYTELLRLSWPSGRSDFPAGSLLNRVVLRPMIWLEAHLDDWDPGTIHPEFRPPVKLDRGDVLALAPEYVLSVGQAKFAPLESIFELRRAPHVTEGQVTVDPAADRIMILVAPTTFDVIALLRGRSGGQPVVMNAVYLPAVMEVLDLLRTGQAEYDGYRWHQPFMAKCDSKGIDVSGGGSILENAQALLDRPMHALARLVTEGEA